MALFPHDFLSLLQRLQELHLQENSIELLEDQALAGLSSLALLDLSRNQLGTISKEALQPLSSLQVLRLTGNSSFVWVSQSKAVPAGRGRLRYRVGSYCQWWQEHRQTHTVATSTWGVPLTFYSP